MKKRSIRWIAVGAMLGGVLASSSSSSVQADTFYPLPGKPAVTVVHGDSPLNPGTSTIETVTATIGLNATVGDLDTVVLCAYKPNDAGGLLGFPAAETPIDSVRLACDGDNHNRIKIVWTQSSNAFAAALGGTLGSGADLSTATTGTLAGSDYTPVGGSLSATAQALQVTFKFTVGPAALAGNDWVISVAANYPNSVCQQGGFDALCTAYSGFSADDLVGSGAVTDRTAAYHQIVQTGGERGRGAAGLSYGFLKDGQTSGEVTSTDNPDGNAISYITNDYSSLTLRGTDFSRWNPSANEGAGAYVAGDTLTLYTGTGEASLVPSGSVAIDCRDFSSTDEALTMYRVATSDSGISLEHIRNASTSTAKFARIICKLTYGGGAQVALQEYSNTVTVGLAQTS